MSTTEPSREPAAPPGDGGLVRLRIDCGYDGKDFSGWAVQPELRTVQGEIELALSRVLRLPAIARVTCAGRTDTGVHADGQVAHVDVPAAAWSAAVADGSERLLHRLRRTLPADIRVASVEAAPSGFHARWSASERQYLYRLCDDPRGPLPLERGFVATHRGPALDLGTLATGAGMLLGEHDFAAFCRPRPGASTARTVVHFAVVRDAGRIVFDVRADAFCHAMVRSMIGALLDVGSGRQPLDWLAALLGLRARPADLMPAAARGLTLLHVTYPDDVAAAALRHRRHRGNSQERTGSTGKFANPG